MSNIPDIIEKSRLAIETGQIDWPTALIRAISVWPLARETYHGRKLNYFIAGEAFDFLPLLEEGWSTLGSRRSQYMLLMQLQYLN